MTIEYVFSISTGRSGSHYLSEVFRHVEGCVSEHEARPRMNRDPMREYLAGRPQQLEALMPTKLASIEKLRGNERVYVETNHCFIKGFGWLIPKHIPENKIGIVILRRDPAEVRASFTRVLSSPFLKSGDNWIITPAANPRLVPLPSEFSLPLLRFHAYRLLSRTVARPGILRRLTGGRMQLLPPIRRYESALLDWYIAETEARCQLYRRTFPNITFVDIDVEQLNSRDGVERMLKPLGLTPKASLDAVIGRATNTKKHKGPDAQRAGNG
jgi:hypothetical protein